MIKEGHRTIGIVPAVGMRLFAKVNGSKEKGAWPSKTRLRLHSDCPESLVLTIGVVPAAWMRLCGECLGPVRANGSRVGDMASP